MSMLRSTVRSILKYVDFVRLYRSTHQIITPFTPYLICDYHLSNEIQDFPIKWLNLKSKSLAEHARKVKDKEWVFCEIDLIPMFVEWVLPEIQKPFVLITGKWHLSGLERNKYTDELIRSEKVMLWFSQNMIFEHPKCHPFPYGVEHWSTLDVLREMKKPIRDRRKEIYFCYVTSHAHLMPSIKKARNALIECMDKWLPRRDYLAKLHTYCFVASPMGDRPETYRHWEAIALGCMPISDVPGAYRRLFGENMIYIRKMEDVFELDPNNMTYRYPDTGIVTVSYWVNKVREMTNRY